MMALRMTEGERKDSSCYGQRAFGNSSTAGFMEGRSLTPGNGSRALSGRGEILVILLHHSGDLVAQSHSGIVIPSSGAWAGLTGSENRPGDGECSSSRLREMVAPAKARERLAWQRKGDQVTQGIG